MTEVELDICMPHAPAQPKATGSNPGYGKYKNRSVSVSQNLRRFSLEVNRIMATDFLKWFLKIIWCREGHIGLRLRYANWRDPIYTLDLFFLVYLRLPASPYWMSAVLFLRWFWCTSRMLVRKWHRTVFCRENRNYNLSEDQWLWRHIRRDMGP